jgi:hypothetical protein
MDIMNIYLVLELLFCLSVSVLAQKWKKRTGVVWFIMTLVLTVFFSVFTSAFVPYEGATRTDGEYVARLVVGAGLAWVLILLAVISLPKKNIPN